MPFSALKNISAQEGKKLGLLFLFFFLVISAFWVLKPLRTSSVIKAFGPDYYPVLKTGAVLFIPLVIIAHSMLTCFYTREGLVRIFTWVFLISSWGFWALFEYFPVAPVKIGFYFYVDIYVTVMVTIFWTYLNDMYSSQDARRFYGVIGAGGLVGGIVGSDIAARYSEAMGNHIILVMTLFLVPIFFVIRALRGFAQADVADERKKKVLCDRGNKSGLVVLTEGGKTIRGSKYLIGIVAIVAIYEVVSTHIDYQFSAAVSAAITDRDAMSAYLGKVFRGANLAALAVQLLLTSYIHRRFGVMYGLLFLPVTLLLGSVVFLFVPVLLVLTLTIAGEAAFGYSINQASKEILYVPLDTISKYKSKAVIDMFVVRGAKALGGVILIIYTLWLSRHGFTSKFIMGMNVVGIVLWLGAVVYVGKIFVEKARLERKESHF